MTEATTRTPEHVETEAPVELPDAGLQRVPAGSRLWGRGLILAAVGLAFYFLDKIALLFMDFWLFESMGFTNVFWTNFRTGALLFLVGFAAIALAIAVPAFVQSVEPALRRGAVPVAIFAGLFAGYELCLHFRKFLLFRYGQPFGEADPVFGHDISFYMFDLPAIILALDALIVLVVVFLASSMIWSYLAHRGRPLPTGMRRLTGAAGTMFTNTSVIALIAFGVAMAAREWISRYDVLIKDNYDASVNVGADYLDITGFFSTVNGYTVTALALLFGMTGLALRLRALHRSVASPDHTWLKIGALSLVLAMVPGLVIDTGFRAMTALRHETQVTPNEPVVQLPYIQRHVDATRAAYDLDKVERIDFVPNGPGAPKANVDQLLASPTLRNAPLWPGYVAWLERQVDPEYVNRILATGGDTLIYGPTLEIFRAQQQLRPYYDFMDVDTVRYHVGGQDVLMASAVRELPLVEPQPWLAWWGQQYLLFTHGHGLVATPVSGRTDAGEPDYASKDVPSKARMPELDVRNNAVYYGEGSGSVGYSNVEDVPEHDYPTEQGRAEVFFPEDVRAGVKIDSFFKRIVFGYKSRQFLDVVFSDLIKDSTRVHYFRMPVERIERIAPFLWTDTDPYAVAAQDGITWMVNALTTGDRYPYSMRGDLGDKSHVRSPASVEPTVVNYAKDAVKATVDAYTGQVNFYKWADEPVVNSWARIYPGLFKDKETMPADVREQVQYPPQLFHLQFDDLYIYYQMEEALTYFSMEDMFDDADEVLGPILSEGSAISFSIEPYAWIAEAGNTMPAAQDRSQFALSMAFTPENAINLRSIATVYQEGEDYGRLSMLQIPKGHFVMGPEQADAAIDQDAFISQQIALWNRQGLDVIRGHTTPLVIGNELLYIEPLFIRSKQNSVPQLKRVVVVYRGQAGLGETLEEALRAAVDPPAVFPVRPGPELGGEPGFTRNPTGAFDEGQREGGLTTTAPRDPASRPRGSR